MADRLDSSIINIDGIERQIERAQSKDAALDILVSAIDHAMTGLKLNDKTTTKTERNKVALLLARAEQIKHNPVWRNPLPTPDERTGPVSSRPPTKSEQIVLLKASYVNNGKYPPWNGRPSPSEFELDAGGIPFLDDFHYALSKGQVECLAGWERAGAALPAPSGPPSTSSAMATAAWHVSTDLVQDAATDCSVVASLCALAARAPRGCRPLLANIFYPYDWDIGRPALSPNGKYIAKLNFNGTFRRVVIDDRLPVSKTQRMIHVFDRHNPRSVFPALVEKLYLKIFGGYDFPGSNSSTDLWVLVGWIPEQVYLANHEVRLAETWHRIWEAHAIGNVMITLGTGKMSAVAERQIGLAGQHNYAVLDLKEQDGQKLMLVKNPWSDGQAWRGSRPKNISNAHGFDEDLVSSPRDLLNSDSKLVPGTFWMDLYTVSQHFESIFLNWNPRLFACREDIHFAWDLGADTSRRTFIDTPQFSLVTQKDESVWILLCRHILDGDYNTAEQQAGAGPPAPVGFIGLSLYDCSGHKVILRALALQDTPLVDSSQTLLQATRLIPGTRYTIVPNEDGLPHPRHTFTLSVFSDNQVTLGYASNKFAHSDEAKDEWTAYTGGGSTDSAYFCANPQYNVSVTRTTAASLLLESRDPALAVNVKVCVSNGGRIQGLRKRDIVADSGTYQPSFALTTVRELLPGRYTIICSTYERDQLGTFRLRLDSDVPLTLQRLPNEAAGRFRKFVSPAVFGSEQQACAMLLLPQEHTRFICVVRSDQSAGKAEGCRQERSLVRVSIVQGSHLGYRTIKTSYDGDFMDAFGGVRTDETDLYPGMIHEADVWLLVERSVCAKDLEEESFAVEFFTETKHAVQTGDWLEWEL